MNTRNLWHGSVILVLLAGATVGCAVNPATGERQLSLVSEAQEVQIGRQSAEQIRQTMSMVDDPELQQYVSDLGQKLAADSERPDLPWSFSVVDDPTPNAFALPGGFIYVTRGMLNLMNNEAELALVLGHEIAHVTARHSVAQISRAQLAQLGLGLGMILIPEARPFGDLAGLGMNLLMLKYGRDAEREADELGFGYAQQQNYDVSQMGNVFESLGRMSDLEGQSPLPSWFATHPAPEERVEAVEERLAGVISEDPDAIVDREEYLDHIDGLPYGNNPRNGFFRDGTFYHPDLEFTFSVPSDWQTRNLARAVVAQNAEGNAAMQLTLIDVDEPVQALRQFAGQEGVQVGRASEDTVNGLSAASGLFQARTQQGQVAGLVSFIGHGEYVYQIVTFTPAQAFAQQQDEFARIAESFAPLDDPEILAVEPPVIDIVRVDAAMTLAEFDRRYPSAIPTERLALLNQLDGPESRVEAGTHLKRVVGDPELFAQNGRASGR